jgi:hypothetical protein
LNCFREEALCALKEAIMTAHKANDNVCLQYALAWLHKLSDENKVRPAHILIVKNVTKLSMYVMHKTFSLQEILIERSISKSSDLNLSYLTSLGIQSFAQYAGVTGGKPALVFDVSMNFTLQFE